MIIEIRGLQIQEKKEYYYTLGAKPSLQDYEVNEPIAITFIDNEFAGCRFNFTGMFNLRQWAILAKTYELIMKHVQEHNHIKAHRSERTEIEDGRKEAES